MLLFFTVFGLFKAYFDQDRPKNSALQGSSGRRRVPFGQGGKTVILKSEKKLMDMHRCIVNERQAGFICYASGLQQFDTQCTCCCTQSCIKVRIASGNLFDGVFEC